MRRKQSATLHLLTRIMLCVCARACAVLFTDDPGKWTQILTQFDRACQIMGLHMSWSKTCLQNTGYGPLPHAVNIQCNTVKVTDCFTYCGSDISSCRRSTPGMFRRIGLGSSIMNQPACVWRQSRLSLSTKLRLYNTLVIPPPTLSVERRYSVFQQKFLSFFPFAA